MHIKQIPCGLEISPKSYFGCALRDMSKLKCYQHCNKFFWVQKWERISSMLCGRNLSMFVIAMHKSQLNVPVTLFFFFKRRRGQWQAQQCLDSWRHIDIFKLGGHLRPIKILLHLIFAFNTFLQKHTEMNIRIQVRFKKELLKTEMKWEQIRTEQIKINDR